MSEHRLIEYIRALASGSAYPWLKVGIGDDAAFLDLPAGGQAVLTTDMTIEGTHFEAGTAAALVGRKAVARAVSDLAAVAARPLCSLAAVDFGSWPDARPCEELVRAIHDAAAELSAPLIGGDVASGTGPLCVTVTAMGTPGPAGFVSRSGARAGDAVCVTGRLGGSGRGRHLTFRPRIEEALALAERFELHAMIDVSDGLSTDALHVAEASGVGISLLEEDVPLAEDAVALGEQTGREPLWHALNDGEDYELLFCLPGDQAGELAREGVQGTPVSIVGRVTAERASFLVNGAGRRRPLKAEGWEHLS